MGVQQKEHSETSKKLDVYLYQGPRDRNICLSRKKLHELSLTRRKALNPESGERPDKASFPIWAKVKSMCKRVGDKFKFQGNPDEWNTKSFPVLNSLDFPTCIHSSSELCVISHFENYFFSGKSALQNQEEKPRKKEETNENTRKSKKLL